ncbi:hypothetical protein LAUMK42_04766 [Mycobacterium persicum]|uniref:TfuA-like core domain-containing protein n=1 Tax=Mycobacterium persicum TaxID=1487726 RepID=A0AB38UYQ4_9MYCO|nr:hypothetical protein B1T49_10440 [Mycobacterium persicum]VAZ85924.1 hypothetical protein LAUMK42_04766 [Mycobacterium persicum]
MTTSPRIVVTAGPTIDAEGIRAVVPDAEVMPPISLGQALGYGLRPGDTLLIIDGLFFQHPSVRHKELLTLIADGIRVVGSSSMGALRAAELHPFGMKGYGWVFESYRSGLLDADDQDCRKSLTAGRAAFPRAVAQRSEAARVAERGGLRTG